MTTQSDEELSKALGKVHESLGMHELASALLIAFIGKESCTQQEIRSIIFETTEALQKKKVPQSNPERTQEQTVSMIKTMGDHILKTW